MGGPKKLSSSVVKRIFQAPESATALAKQFKPTIPRWHGNLRLIGQVRRDRPAGSAVAADLSLPAPLQFTRDAWTD